MFSYDKLKDKGEDSDQENLLPRYSADAELETDQGLGGTVPSMIRNESGRHIMTEKMARSVMSGASGDNNPVEKAVALKDALKG